jgi:hypothetical protein
MLNLSITEKYSQLHVVYEFVLQILKQGDVLVGIHSLIKGFKQKLFIDGRYMMKYL